MFCRVLGDKGQVVLLSADKNNLLKAIRQSAQLPWKLNEQHMVNLGGLPALLVLCHKAPSKYKVKEDSMVEHAKTAKIL